MRAARSPRRHALILEHPQPPTLIQAPGVQRERRELARQRIEQPAAQLALEWPAWGHRKIWALLRADGIRTSQSTVLRALAAAGSSRRPAFNVSAANWHASAARRSSSRSRAALSHADLWSDPRPSARRAASGSRRARPGWQGVTLPKKRTRPLHHRYLNRHPSPKTTRPNKRCQDPAKER
jgi:hypothetical protein